MQGPEVPAPVFLRDFHGVIFDLDGTLIDTLADIADAANCVLRQHGFPTHPLLAYRQFIGDGVQQLLFRALPDQHRDATTLAACMKTMQLEYPRHLNRKARPYAGVTELTTALQRLGLRLAVLSNKPDEFTAKCVSDFFPAGLFDPIFGLRPGCPRKPDPTGALQILHQWAEPARSVLYLGDSGTDMQTAVNAGLHPVGVLWGYRDAKELRHAGAQRLLHAPGELLSTGD